MLNIPELTGLFEPQPYKPPVNALENNLSTVAALQDPSGTLRKMQADQIANATADIKMDEIDAQYKGIALGAINEYQNKRKEMYNGNKGFNRLSLSGEQLLEDQRSYKSLVNDINIMKNVTKENRDTMADVSKMFAAQTITREDYDAFEKERMAADAKAKTIGDIPNYRNILNNYLRTKPVKWDANTSKSPYKTPEQVADVILKPQQGKTVKEYSQATTEQQVQYMYDSPLWNSDIRPMMYQFGVFRMGMSPEQEYRAMLDYSKNRFNDAESRNRGGIVNNWGSSKPKRVPFVENTDGTKSWVFQDEPINYTRGKWKGYIVGVTKGSDGKFYGELSIPIINEVKEEKTLLSTGVKRVVDKFGNEVYITPLDASDYGAIKRKGLDLENAQEEGFNDLGKQRERTSKGKQTAKYPLPAGKPMTVNQGGYTYTWNESTGKYE